MTTISNPSPRTRPRRRQAVRLLAAALAACLWMPALASRVGGRVTDKTGAPIADATVTLVPVDQGRASRQSLKTNKDGRYIFGIVPEGSLWIEVSYEELVPLTVKLVVFDAAEHKNVVDYSGAAPEKPQPFTVDINRTVTYDVVLVPVSETPKAIAAAKAKAEAEERQRAIAEVPALLGDGKYQEALARVEEGLKVRPDSPDLHYLKAFSLYRLNDLDGAALEAHTSLTLRPDQPGAHFILAQALVSQEKKAEALVELEAEMANPPTDAGTRNRARLSAGELHRQLGETDKAIATFEQVTKDDPKMADAWNALAELYMKTGQHDKAVAAQEQARTIGTEDPVLVFNLGAESWNRKDFAKAADYFRHATELDPNMSAAWKNLGYACVNLGKTEEALKALRKYLELSPKAEDAAEIRELIAAIGKG